ncbi:MAG TPA: cytochrome ubiquinol oxidase subunit I [Polyangiales bacterium]|nr:cytochrome ubiquinol oxidase subunit I [Polyangiales bacterium]
MDDLVAARLQMAISLGFHIVFACIGMTMPWLMAAAQWKFIRTRRPVYLQLARAWSKGVAVFFAVGAVSGTVLSFELGLLWPKFMEHAGPIIGLPFSWEGTAFFVEAIAIGIFLYGFGRVPERIHFASGIVVGLSGVASGVLVVAANSWMNSPAGFRWVDGQAVDVDPVAAMFNPAWPSQALHMTLAAFVSTAFGVAGVHAFRLLKNPSSEMHRIALRVALAIGAVAALLQPLSGDISAQHVTKRQPAKLAAMEAHYHTERNASFMLGGIPDDDKQVVRGAIEIPYLLSLLAHHDPFAEVTGLDRIPRENWPPTLICHIAFQIMIAAGTALAGLGTAFLGMLWLRPKWLEHRRFLKVVAAATPLGFIAVEAGWTVTEVGRQPWIIYGVLRTKDAVTPMPGLVWPLMFMLVVYLVLGVVIAWIMTHLIRLAEDAEKRGTSADEFADPAPPSPKAAHG